ncbi:nodulation protein NolB [Microvirga sp. KLBC 81]|uniref:nodulation protein NolB n=1 Tax=Microvirga sp. KLBC 81 TaxID=1862707 RepID=UPI001FE10AFC|nr:nodulation protein NolB [Microvirga sp. KLBC 81]
MLAATPISPNLTNSLPRIGSAEILGEQARFQHSLVQAASIKNDVPSATDKAAPVPPLLEVQRATTQTSPLGERVLQTLSAMYRSNTVPSAAASSESALAKSVQPGPAAQRLPRPEGVGVRTAGQPEGADRFEPMLANLRDVYNSAIQVSLVTKSTGAVTSSLNKLLSAG